MGNVIIGGVTTVYLIYGLYTGTLDFNNAHPAKIIEDFTHAYNLILK